MKRTQSTLWHSVGQFVLGSLALAMATLLCFRLDLNFSTTAFIYLIVLVLLSLVGGFISSAVLCIVAVGCLNLFFASPIFNFRVDYPVDIVAVVAFLMTSLIVTGLVQAARKKTEVALQVQEQIREDERELRQLIDIVPQHIFVMSPDGAPLSANDVWLKYAGLTQADVQQMGYRERLYHPDDLERLRDQRHAALARCPNVGSKARTLPLQVAGDSKVIQSSLADRHHLVAPGELRQRIDRRLGRVLVVRMNADAGVDVRMIGRELKHAGQLRQIDADAECVRDAVPGHRGEHIGKLARELGKIDVTVGVDEHGTRAERSGNDHRQLVIGRLVQRAPMAPRHSL